MVRPLNLSLQEYLVVRPLYLSLQEYLVVRPLYLSLQEYLVVRTLYLPLEEYLVVRTLYLSLKENLDFLRAQNHFAKLIRKSVEKISITQYENDSPLNLCLQEVSVLLKHVTLSNNKYECSYLMNLPLLLSSANT